MKVLKFGGTSVGTPQRMKDVVKLITDGEQKIVVLSAMSGTTNSLVEISDYLYKKNPEGANETINTLEKKYKKIVKNLRYKLQSVIEENRTLRNVLNAKDKEKEQMEYHYQNELKNMSLYNNTIYQNNNSIGNGNEVESEDEQKVALEDFKRLLSKIDEKTRNDLYKGWKVAVNATREFKH